MKNNYIPKGKVITPQPSNNSYVPKGKVITPQTNITQTNTVQNPTSTRRLTEAESINYRMFGKAMGLKNEADAAKYYDKHPIETGGILATIGNAIDTIPIVSNVKRFIFSPEQGGTYKGQADNRTGLERFVGSIPVVGGAVGTVGDVGAAGTAAAGNLISNVAPGFGIIKEIKRNMGQQVNDNNIIQDTIDAYKYNSTNGQEGKNVRFGDQLNLPKGIVNDTVSFAAPFFLDPTNKLNPASIVKYGKVVNVANKAEPIAKATAKVAETVAPIAKKISQSTEPVKDFLGNKFVYGYGLAPEAKQALLNEQRNLYNAKDYANLVGKAIDKGTLTKQEIARGQTLAEKYGYAQEFNRLAVTLTRKGNKMTDVEKASFSKLLDPSNTIVPEKFKKFAPTEVLQQKASVARGMIDKNTQQLIKSGIIEPSKTIDNYVQRVYTRYEDPETWAKQLSAQSAKDLKSGKISPQAYAEVEQTVASILEKKNSINMPSTSVSISTAKEGAPVKFSRKELSVEARQYLGQIDGAYPVAKTLANQQALLAKTELLNMFKGYAKDTYEAGLHAEALPKSLKYGELAGKYVPEPVYRALTLADNPGELAGLQKIFKPITDVWKQFKVGVFNPSFFISNFGSGVVMNYLNGMKAADLVKYTPQALKEVLEAKIKGIFSPAYKEAVQGGLFSSGFYDSNQFKQLLPQTAKTGIQKAKDIAGKAKDNIFNGNLSNAPFNDYVEQVNRYAAFKYARDVKKLSPADAISFAERGQFNYNALTPFEQGLKNSAIPFYTFQKNAAIQLARTIWENPNAIRNIYRLTDNLNRDQRQGLPEYAQQRIGIIPTDSGFIDVGRYIPYANSLDLTNTVSQAATAGPILGAVTNVVNNYDPFRKKAIVPTEELGTQYAFPDQMAYITQQMAPPIVNNIVNKVIPAVRGGQEIAGSGRVRSFGETALDSITGIKNTPVDREAAARSQQYTKENALKTIQSNIRKIYKDKNLSPQGRQEQLLKQEKLRQYWLSK